MIEIYKQGVSSRLENLALFHRLILLFERAKANFKVEQLERVFFFSLRLSHMPLSMISTSTSSCCRLEDEQGECVTADPKPGERERRGVGDL